MLTRNGQVTHAAGLESTMGQSALVSSLAKSSRARFGPWWVTAVITVHSAT